MAGEKHLLLSIIGDYTPASLSGESWVNTYRLALDVASIPDIGTFSSAWDPTAQTISRTETDWTITSNWRISQGAVHFSPDDYLNDQVAPAITDWMTSTQRSSRIRVRALKLSPIGAPTGKLVPAIPYSTGTPCTLTYTSGYPVGTNTGGMLPLQNSLVASHRTNQIGRTGRGRVFLTGLQAGVLDTDGRMLTAQRDSLRDAEVTFLEAIAFSGAGVGGWDVRPCVTGAPWSRYALISQVRVGDVVDTQRRRRRGLVEDYSSASVTY